MQVVSPTFAEPQRKSQHSWQFWCELLWSGCNVRTPFLQGLWLFGPVIRISHVNKHARLISATLFTLCSNTHCSSQGCRLAAQPSAQINITKSKVKPGSFSLHSESLEQNADVSSQSSHHGRYPQGLPVWKLESVDGESSKSSEFMECMPCMGQVLQWPKSDSFPIFSGCFCSSALILVCAEGEHGEVELKLCNTAIPTSSRQKS